MPHEVQPMLATLVNEPFDSEDWVYEIKWDGYRAIAEVNGVEVNLYSRNNLPFNTLFKIVADELKTLQLHAVLDGEVVALDEKGLSKFQLIQNYKTTGKGNIVFYVFDILYLDGKDLTGLTLLERKEILKSILVEGDHVRYNDHIIEKGIDFYGVAEKKGLEGIIAKKATSKYHEGSRSKDWLKIKTEKRQEAVIAGFTAPRGGRKFFGALVLGIYKNNKLTYVGHTGGGFNDAVLKEVYKMLQPLTQDESPFEDVPKTNMPVTWVSPKLICEIKFQEWTGDGHMRIPIFIGMRADKDPKEVTLESEKAIEEVFQDDSKKTIAGSSNKKSSRMKKEDTSKIEKEKKKKVSNASKSKTSKSLQETKIAKTSKNKSSKTSTPVKKKEKTAAPVDHDLKLDVEKIDLTADANEATIKVEKHSLKFTNLKKIYWEELGYTKQDLIEYYDKISSYILPYLKDRPENLRRNPNGYKEPGFFHKDMSDSLPEWIETVKIYSESNDEHLNYMICQNKASLLYMANLGCIELNPWLSRKQSLDKPDYIVIDLDPQDVPFEEVIRVALAVKTVLDKGKIEGYPKTSGSRGIHIYIPLGAKYDYDQAKQFAELIASLTHELTPDITSLERSPAKRRNKIYLDFLQNRTGQTLAAPYCVRPRIGATVSTPLLWEEIKPGLSPSQFDMKNIFSRLEKKGDLFKGILGKGADMKKAIQLFS